MPTSHLVHSNCSELFSPIHNQIKILFLVSAKNTVVYLHTHIQTKTVGNNLGRSCGENKLNHVIQRQVSKRTFLFLFFSLNSGVVKEKKTAHIFIF